MSIFKKKKKNALDLETLRANLTKEVERGKTEARSKEKKKLIAKGKYQGEDGKLYSSADAYDKAMLNEARRRIVKGEGTESDTSNVNLYAQMMGRKSPFPDKEKKSDIDIKRDSLREQIAQGKEIPPDDSSFVSNWHLLYPDDYSQADTKRYIPQRERKEELKREIGSQEKKDLAKQKTEDKISEEEFMNKPIEIGIEKGDSDTGDFGEYIGSGTPDKYFKKVDGKKIYIKKETYDIHNLINQKISEGMAKKREAIDGDPLGILTK